MSTCQNPDPHLASQVAGERGVVPAPTVAEVRVDVVGVRNRRAVALGILEKKTKKMRIKKMHFFFILDLLCRTASRRCSGTPPRRSTTDESPSNYAK